MRVIAIISGYLDTAGNESARLDGVRGLRQPAGIRTGGRGTGAGRPGLARRLIIRRVAPDEWPATLAKCPEDIKVVVDMTASLRKERVK
jgi:hypothetical protein